MLCSRCKKRPAVIMIGTMENGEAKNEMICIQCAKELGISDVDKMMKSMGINEEMLEQMQDMLDDMEESGELEGLTQTMPYAKDMINNIKSMDLNAFKNNLQDGAKESDGTEKNISTAKDSKSKKEEKANKKGKYKMLDGYCINLNKKAINGNVDRLIGRERETERVIQILCRRQKNNPCLIGEPGVGKTAIAEGLASAIVSENVPAKLLDKEIYLVDLTALVAGTQFRGQFEGRVKALIDEVQRKGNVILVIDEIHNIVGVGDVEGSMNAGNILKPALSRGEIQIIGATTFAEYRKYIEKDAALERRFQPVTVEEPSISQTIDILSGIKGYYEEHHKVKVSSKIIENAVTMSERYITDRFLPDKAIDLLDEACSNVSIHNKQLNDLLINERELKKIKGQIADIEDEISTQEDNDVKNELYQTVANLRSKECACQAEIDKNKSISFPELTVRDLSKVIEIWTGIPASKTEVNDYKQLEHLEENLNKIVIGQKEAVATLSNAIIRNRVGLSAQKRPASFIFVGPTGIGKTYLVKTLADELFDSVESLIRLDMSEFMEKHSVSKIIGSPPGYVGYDEAGQLTEKIRRKPYSVILFDEIEKAHPDVLNILLQILDDGHITDAHGRKVDFSNTVIVMTSNAGSEEKGETVGFNRMEKEIIKEKAMKALGSFLRPEFINRIDEVVVFNPLSKENIIEISKIMLSELCGQMEKRGISFNYTNAVIEYITSHCNYKKFGARDLRRFIQKQIEDAVAKVIIENNEKTLVSVSVNVENEKVKVDTVLK